MSLEMNKLVTRRFLKEVVNTGNVERLAEFISPGRRETNDSTGQAVGLDSMRAHVLGVRQTYPDLQITVEQQIAEGDRVAPLITARGTHTGHWLGIKPMGRQVVITGVNLDRVVNGRIVEHGGAANMFEAFLSIGAIQLVGDKQGDIVS
jgi:predicted ester cyclase